MSYNANYKVKTTARTFHIIEYLCQNGATGVSQISSDLDISKSIVHNHLSTLRELGYVIKDSQQYRLSLRFFEIGAQVRDDSQTFRTIKQGGAAVADRLDTVVYLLEREGKTGVITQVWGATNPATTDLKSGDRFALTESVLGHALLAELREENREAILEQIDDDAKTIQNESTTSENSSVISGPLIHESDKTAIATGIVEISEASAGAVGVQLPVGVDQETVQVIETALESLKNDETEREHDRSFASMKHSWFTE